MRSGVSVIIPTHNRVHTLPRALDSVLAQSHAVREIIVIDDGSNDGTPDLMTRHYSNCVYLRQDNRGVSAARNRGIREANGEWLALLDSDDSWMPEKLERQLGRLTALPQLRLCHSEEIWIRNGKRVNAMRKHAKQGGQIFEHCLPLCVISPSAALLHHRLFDDYGGFDEELPACEDYDLWLRICSREAVAFVDEPLVVKYGGHEDQLSRRHWGMDRFRVHALRKLLDTQHLSSGDRLKTLQTLEQKCRILIQGAEKRNAPERAAEYRAVLMRYARELQP
ncbi:MAG: glycosyltransferase [Candidatus Thiodiazotropha sp.]